MKQYPLFKNAFLFSRRFLICKIQIKPMPSKNRSKVGIDVVEKIISLKEVDQEFLTNKTILAYLGGVRARNT